MDTKAKVNIINQKMHGKGIKYPKFLYKYRPFDEFAFDMLENLSDC